MGTKQNTKPAAAKAKPAATPAAPAVQYALGKPYHVRPGTAYGNDVTWGLIQKQLEAHGPQTQAQLLELVKPRNHSSFVGYAIRRGWLAAAKA